MARAECKALGRVIRKFRIQRGMTQAILADHAELSRESISAIENGRFDPTFSTLLRISKALDLKMEQLLKSF